ncbi:acetate uptake transporter [Streptomyces sp. NPDC090306]|uniref:acetate uptake transporter n=1 Tax=Streptomyces sp. NPDC090306 TaxID=3365961 RepID=UPI003817C5DA
MSAHFTDIPAPRSDERTAAVHPDGESRTPYPDGKPRVPRPPAVVGREVASPDTLGLWAFAVGTFLGNLPDTGLVGRTGLTITVAVLLGGLAQLIAGVEAYRAGSVFGATSFTAFGLFWITIGTTDWLTALHVLAPVDHVALGWYLALWTIFAGILFGATPALNRALEITVGLSCAGLFAKAVGSFTDDILLTRTGAWLLVACAVAALYTTAAGFWNAAYRRTVLPLGVPAGRARS